MYRGTNPFTVYRGLRTSVLQRGIDFLRFAIDASLALLERSYTGAGRIIRNTSVTFQRLHVASGGGVGESEAF